MAHFPELDALRSVEELESRCNELEAEMSRMAAEHGVTPFDDEEREHFASMKEEHDEAARRIKEFNATKKIVEGFASRDKNVERESRAPAIRRDSSDIYDLSTLNRSSEQGTLNDLRERALRSIDTTTFPDRDAKDHVSRLLDNIDHEGALARRILQTGSPVYKRAFGKVIANKPRTAEEERALSIGSTGYAVPYVVDPTVVLTSNGAINPVRQLARVIQIAGNHWTGVASAGITASYDAEAAEVSDDTPSLSQPVADVEMARAFVQYSVELDEDWGSLQAEMGRLFADAKDMLESTKFLKGVGHASHEPEGILIGSNTGTLSSTNSSAIIVGDLYSLQQQLAPRWRSRASFTGALGAFNKIRQLDTAGGANLWVQLSYDQPATLLGKPAFEWSDYSFSTTGTNITGGSTVLTFGDFNEFSIIDRIGMNVEAVPLMLNTANNRPDGTRGLFAYWRNTSDVRTAAAFAHLVIKS